jgi:ubiquinone biosynthesis protein
MAANVNALTTALRQAPQLIERGARIVDALEAENTEFNKAPRSGGSRLAMVIPLWAGTAALIVIAVKLLLG